MKRNLMLMVLVSLLYAKGFAQKIKEADVPQAVKTSFVKSYPSVNPAWEKEKGNYEAGFKKNGKEMSVVLTPDGKLVESEVGISEKELPPAATEYIKTNYKGKRVKEYAKITAANGKITYEAEIEGKDVIFDSNGSFIKESMD